MATGKPQKEILEISWAPQPGCHQERRRERAPLTLRGGAGVALAGAGTGSALAAPASKTRGSGPGRSHPQPACPWLSRLDSLPPAQNTSLPALPAALVAPSRPSPPFGRGRQRHWDFQPGHWEAWEKDCGSRGSKAARAVAGEGRCLSQMGRVSPHGRRKEPFRLKANSPGHRLLL